MSYRDILVFLDGSRDNDARLDIAISLAKAHDAKLTGVDVSSAAAFEGEWSERARRVGESFESKAGAAGLSSRFKIVERESAGWKDFYVHYADLLIATQPNRQAAGKILSAIPEDVLISSGVPMIVLPHRWTSKPIMQNVVIAWSPSSQATRAVHDAMPILAQAQRVSVFAFDPPSDRNDADIKMLCDHLLTHGITAETEPWPDTGELSVIEALFASRCMEDADMIVAGAYSHSRFRETLFGGVTRDLLRQFSLPVFVSH
ncbi:universal stress protein [Nordella sp. HKS 07]|uniref:universal stress protein n=1 Tax=Nordella sp. HKS 07 TaxID=2712222 RepID=UPI0013E13F1A|nr:universal stress protein [Nordella sp. HKS 07]QIG51014.1 universal stress protein [Nordella sp. HKS 07]